MAQVVLPKPRRRTRPASAKESSAKPPRLTKPARPTNFGELLKQLGDVPPSRVRLDPPPGQATKRDLLRLAERDKILCELINGTLVEKAVGQKEAELGSLLIFWLLSFTRPRDLGRVFGADAPHELAPGLVRMPDVAFVSNERYPKDESRHKPIAPWAPNLAVEILSKSNTKREIENKRREYFDAGVELVWIVDHRKKTVWVYTDADQFVALSEDDMLDGGTVLPGFELSIREWFAAVE